MSRNSASQEMVMLDLETLGTHVFTAPMISLGAVKFLPNGEITDRFKVNVSPQDLVKNYHFKAEKGTIEWWKKQDPQAIAALQDNQQLLVDAIDQFLEWYGTKSLRTWANGIDFDFPILKSHILAVGKVLPWKYWDQADYRTVCNIFGVNNKEMRSKSTDNIYHDAVADCIGQVEILTTILKPLWVEE